MLGSIPNASPWHGVWHWLMEDTTPARGALASANATRTRPCCAQVTYLGLPPFRPHARSHACRSIVAPDTHHLLLSFGPSPLSSSVA